MEENHGSWERGGRLRMVQGVKSTVAPATHASKAKAQAKAKARSPVKQKKRVPVAVKKGARVMKVAKVKARQRAAATCERGRQRQRQGSEKRENAPVAKRQRSSEEPEPEPAAAEANSSSNSALEAESGVQQIPSGAAAPQDGPQQAQSRSSSEQGVPLTPDQLLQRVGKRIGERKQTKPRAAVRHWVMTDGWPDEAIEPEKNEVQPCQSSVREKGDAEDDGEGQAPPEQDGVTSTPTPTENTENFPHRSPHFQSFLKARGVGLWGHPDGVVEEDIAVYRSLFEHDCETPKDTIFDNSRIFDYLCDKLHTRSKRELVLLVSKLLIPPAPDELWGGSARPIPLVDGRDAAWDCSLALDAEEGEREGMEEGEDEGYAARLFRARIPRPHYSVGFHSTAFTLTQRDKLQPLLGGLFDTSYFKGAIHMLFPFFTAEAKDPDRRIEEAEAQNAHAMALALRGVVRLFQLANRKQDIHRRILGYSIAFNHSSVRIHAHYPFFTETARGDSQSESSSRTEVSYYRKTLRKFDFTDPSGKERWTSYKFVMALYNEWVPEHHKRLCAVIDALPEREDPEFSLGSTVLDFGDSDDAE